MSMKSKTTQLRIAATLALNAIEEHLVGTYIDWHDVARVLREALNEMQKKKMPLPVNLNDCVLLWQMGYRTEVNDGRIVTVAREPKRKRKTA